MEAAHMQRALPLAASVPVAYQQALLSSSAFKYFPHRRIF
jgi:hypothetical protein